MCCAHRLPAACLVPARRTAKTTGTQATATGQGAEGEEGAAAAAGGAGAEGEEEAVAGLISSSVERRRTVMAVQGVSRWAARRGAAGSWAGTWAARAAGRAAPLDAGAWPSASPASALLAVPCAAPGPGRAAAGRRP